MTQVRVVSMTTKAVKSYLGRIPGSGTIHKIIPDKLLGVLDVGFNTDSFI